jgi:hypothetical protein
MFDDRKISAYLMALFTALLSIIGAAIASFQITSLQANQSIAERKAACRKEAYITFLSRIDRKSDPAISELLGIGVLADKVSTDSQIQDLENHFSKLLERSKPQVVYIQLSSDLNLLRLCGSREVNRRADDLLDVLIGDFSGVDTSHYSANFRQYYHSWLTLQQGKNRAYGWEERISPQERASLILTNATLRQLLSAMNVELQGRTQ